MAMRAKLNPVIKVETEAEIIMKALAEEECLVRKPASSACCDEEEKVESNSMIDELAENSALNQLEEEEKMSKKEMEMDLEADRLLAPEWMESMSKIDELKNYAEVAEQPDFKKLMLRQFNLNTKEVEKHADAKQLNYMMKAETEAEENKMQLKKDLVEVSLSKMVEMKLMHALKAEAVQVEECEKEGHKAPQLLVDKQAAAAG